VPAGAVFGIGKQGELTALTCGATLCFAAISLTTAREKPADPPVVQVIPLPLPQNGDAAKAIDFAILPTTVAVTLTRGNR
jgi:hypothetical protein